MSDFDEDWGWAEPEDFDLMYDRELGVTCRRCGAEKLHWERVGLRWTLFDETMQRHSCDDHKQLAKKFGLGG